MTLRARETKLAAVCRMPNRKRAAVDKIAQEAATERAKSRTSTRRFKFVRT